MNNNFGSSGFVEISEADIEMAIEALREEQLLVAARCDFRMNEDERVRHDALELWIASWIRQFSDMDPGRVHFARKDMERLRGILFNGFKIRYARRYRFAVMSGDRRTAVMGPRLHDMEKFESRMWDPEPFAGSAICFERAVADRAVRRAGGFK